MEQEQAWSEQLAAAIGKRVAYYRARAVDDKGKKLTAQALADRCSEIGHPLDRSVIAKLEKGHRAHVTVADWLVLARALGIAPVQLLMPFGTSKPTEILPGREVDSVGAAKWISGEDHFPFPGIDSPDVVSSGEYDSTADLYEWYVDRWYLPSGSWATGAGPVILMRRHQMLVKKWVHRRAAYRAHWRRLQEEDDARTRELTEIYQSAMEQLETDLRRARDEMRALDIELPQIEDDLAAAIGENL